MRAGLGAAGGAHAGSWALRHLGLLRVLSFMAWCGPALLLAHDTLTGQLGPNPLATLLHTTGRWCLTMLLVTLLVTPLRRLSTIVSRRLQARRGKRVSDWNWLVRLRRQFGLFAFFYGVLHLSLYVTLDAGADTRAVAQDLAERPFIAMGALAWLLMLPLALTSHRAAMRALGAWWGRLHQLNYVVVLLGFVHLWLQMKPGESTALPHSGALAVVLLLRAAAWWLGDRQAASEVQRQGAQHRGRLAR